MAKTKEQLDTSILDFQSYRKDQFNKKPYGGAFGSEEINPTAKTYEALVKKTTSFDGTTLVVNGTEVKAKQGAAYAIRDSVGSGGNSMMSSLQEMGNNGIATYNSVMPGIADSGAGIASGIQGGIDSIGDSVSEGASNLKDTISGYTAPLLKSLDAFSIVMRLFDEWIATTFIGQIFGIKGSEIICTVFCIIISFLSCSTRNKLYNIIMMVKAIESAAKQGVNLGVDLTTTYNGDITGPNDIAYATQKLFGDYKSSGLPLLPAEKVLKIMGTPAQPGRRDIKDKPEWSRASLQAPSEVKTIIESITKVLKIITKLRITIPVGINGDIWDLAQAILYALQAMVIQLATELINSAVKPIEDAIRSMIPDNCLSNMASIFFNKIIDTIRKYKQWLLSQIQEFFGASNGFSLKWKTFGLNINYLLEILQIMEGLSLGLSKFADLLLACGLTPCNKQPDEDLFKPEIWQPLGNPATQYPDKAPFLKEPISSKFADVINQTNQKNIMDALKSGADIPMSNIPASRLPLDQMPAKAEHIDDIAKRLAPIMRLPMENIIVTPQELKFIQPGFQNVPPKIARLIADGIVEQNLGPGWTTFANQDNTSIDVVYTFRRSCGD